MTSITFSLTSSKKCTNPYTLWLADTNNDVMKIKNEKLQQLLTTSPTLSTTPIYTYDICIISIVITTTIKHTLTTVITNLMINQQSTFESVAIHENNSRKDSENLVTMK
jgi:hypothetical protein